MTTKFLVFDSGLHSATFTVSPSFASMHSGMCILIFVLFFSYLLYFLSNTFRSKLIDAVLWNGFVDIFSVSICPFVDSPPCIGHFLSWQVSFYFVVFVFLSIFYFT